MKIYHVRAFPKTDNGGNKAGVVLQSDHLTEDEMKFFAKEVGYSETAFVSLSRVADFKVRFFTPYHEVDLCGHATIATFNLMRDLGVIKPGMYTQETKAGILKVDVQDELVYMEQARPFIFDKVNYKEIEECFNRHHFINQNYPCVILSTGLKEMFVPVSDVETLNKLKMDKNAIIELCIKYNVIGLHLFTPGDDCDAYSRNFAPLVGIDEESATGTSNGALGFYFHTYISKQEEYTFRQGDSMNQPSELHVLLKTTNPGRFGIEVWVGGTASLIEDK